MKEIDIGRANLVELSPAELEMRGGITWDNVRKIFVVIQKIIDFIDDYKQDMKDGFRRGWRSL